MNGFALITGASRGIGLEFTRCFARDGTDCVIVARSEERLKEIKREFESSYGVTVKVLARDLSRPAAPDELVRELDEDGVHVHTLVNNAGIGNYGRFDSHSWSEEFDLLHLNVVALTHLTRLLLKPMVKRGEGRIVNVGSVGSFVPGPFMATYYASKAYVLSFSEALAGELSGSDVTVTALCPGVTETGFQKHSGISSTGIIEQIPFKTTPEKVAEYGYEAMKDGKVVAVHGMVNTMIVFVLRFMPRFLIRTIMASIQGSRREEGG